MKRSAVTKKTRFYIFACDVETAYQTEIDATKKGHRKQYVTDMGILYPSDKSRKRPIEQGSKGMPNNGISAFPFANESND